MAKKKAAAKKATTKKAPAQDKRGPNRNLLPDELNEKLAGIGCGMPAAVKLETQANQVAWAEAVLAGQIDAPEGEDG